MGGARGRRISVTDKILILTLITEATVAGARLAPACSTLHMSIRTLQRWRKSPDLIDKRHGPLSEPHNKLSNTEREEALLTINTLKHRDQSPHQIVPQLADQGLYIGSESTIYRLLRAQKMLRHRNASEPKKHRKPGELCATRPCQVWSWDITYMPSTIKGQFFYLYLFLDVFSRKIVGFDVYDEQSAALAAVVVTKAYNGEGVSSDSITLHADNGGPMKGSMMLATLQNLGIAPSFSRPSVSNDNPYSEALFRTLKYGPTYPKKPFASSCDALAWVTQFVHWYNNEHYHSAINFVAPNQRHDGLDEEILKKRLEVYKAAQAKNPKRWSGSLRNMEHIEEVYLNRSNG